MYAYETHVVFSIFHFLQLCILNFGLCQHRPGHSQGENVKLHTIKNGQNYNWSVTLEHFIEHKPPIFMKSRSVDSRLLIKYIRLWTNNRQIIKALGIIFYQYKFITYCLKKAPAQSFTYVLPYIVEEESIVKSR